MEYFGKYVAGPLEGFRGENDDYVIKKEDVKNKDLWTQLDELNSSLEVQWNWVKAHAGNEFNEKVDLLAKKAAKQLD